jgi:hypothetical protein
MAVPYTFATATASIPLSQLDSNFATGITLGNTTVYLGNTTTSIGNLTLTNATISSVASTFPNSYLANSSITLGTTNVSLGGTATTLNGLTFSNVTISTGNVTVSSLTDSGLTSGRVTYAGTGGLLQDSANLVFDGTTLTTLNTAYTGTLTGGTGIVNLGSGQFYKDASGNVMVGTTSGFGSGTYGLRVSNTAVSGFGTLSLQGNRTVAEDTISLVQSFNSSTEVVRIATIQGANATSGQIVFHTASTGTLAEKMRITSAGDVGIGTGSPSSWGKLAVYGTSSGGQVVSAIVNSSGTANTQAVLSFDTSASGFNVRDSQIRSTNNGSNQTTLQFYTSNAATPAEAMRIDSSGNVGIGTSSPSTFSAYTKLSVLNGVAVGVDASNAGRIVGSTTTGTELSYLSMGGNYNIGSTGEIALATTTAKAMLFGTNGTERMRIDSSGNVRLSAGNLYWDVAGTRYISNVGDSSSNINIQSRGYTTFSYGGATVGAGTEAMRIDASGNLLVNGTTVRNSAKVSIDYNGSTNGGMGINDTASANGSSLIAFLTGGTFRGGITNNNNTGVLYNVTSDYRLKTVIGSVSNSGQRIDALEPIEFEWNKGGKTKGFLAHKFAEVYPNSVSGEKNAVDENGEPKYQGMQASSSEVMADLIAEIQSLRKRVAQLESK